MDVDIIIKYAEKYSPVITGLEGRIKVVSLRDSATAPEARTPLTAAGILGEIPNIEIPAIPGIPAPGGTDDNAAVTTAVLGEVPPPGADGATEAQAEVPKTPGSSLSSAMDSISSASDRFNAGLQGVGDRVSSGVQGVGDRVSSGVQGIGERILGAGEKLKKLPERFPIFGRIDDMSKLIHET